MEWPTSPGPVRLANSPVMSVNVCDYIVRDELLEVAGGHANWNTSNRCGRSWSPAAPRSSLLRPVRKRLRWSAAHGFRASTAPHRWNSRAAHRRPDIADACLWSSSAAGRRHVAIDSVAFQIALQRSSVNLDVLYRDRFAPATTGGTSVFTCATRLRASLLSQPSRLPCPRSSAYSSFSPVRATRRLSQPELWFHGKTVNIHAVWSY